MPTLALSPQLLSRAARPPNGDAWLHEIKYDGYRLMASVDRGRVCLRSRPGADWTSRLPFIAQAVASLGVSEACLDGELVYLTDDGFPDFERLWEATRSREQRGRLYYQVFDLLCVNGADLTSRPLLERKARLVDLLSRADSQRVRYVAHTTGNGGVFFDAVDQLGLEGIVCKRATSVYRAGTRSADWVKVKCFRTQHFVVVGYTTEEIAGREVLSSLAMAGRASDEGLVYAGRVEFGVPRRDDTLLRLLCALGTHEAPAAKAPQSRSLMWIEPLLAAEVRALAWKPGRALRHAVLRSLSRA
jgi:bifunctional non-homologous end joining protein LigD